jgi:hypothetical protein
LQRFENVRPLGIERLPVCMQVDSPAEQADSEAPIFTQVFFTEVQLRTHFAASAVLTESPQAITSIIERKAIFISNPPFE